MDKAAFLHIDETAAQLLVRCAATPLETGIYFIDNHTRLRAKHVALLSGGDGTAKSCMLVQVLCWRSCCCCCCCWLCASDRDVQWRRLISGHVTDRRLLLHASGGVFIPETCMFVQVAAHCILPEQAQGYNIGGLEGKYVQRFAFLNCSTETGGHYDVLLTGTCILVDLDLKFDIVCLVNTLTVRLRSALHDLNE